MVISPTFPLYRARNELSGIGFSSVSAFVAFIKPKNHPASMKFFALSKISLPSKYGPMHVAKRIKLSFVIIAISITWEQLNITARHLNSKVSNVDMSNERLKVSQNTGTNSFHEIATLVESFCIKVVHML